MNMKVAVLRFSLPPPSLPFFFQSPVYFPVSLSPSQSLPLLIANDLET